MPPVETCFTGLVTCLLLLSTRLGLAIRMLCGASTEVGLHAMVALILCIHCIYMYIYRLYMYMYMYTYASIVTVLYMYAPPFHRLVSSSDTGC